MLKNLSEYLTYHLFGLSEKSALGESVNFFIYDSIKIILLLIIITHLMSWLRFYLPMDKIRDFLTKKKLFGLDYFLASFFGAITPFCTCSSIPLFVGFLKAGIPLGVTFAFLITSPLINEVAVAMFIGIFGLKVTILYTLAGIIIGMAGGYILGRLKLEKYVATFVYDAKSQGSGLKNEKLPAKKLFTLVNRESFSIVKKVAPYILIGVAVGAAIHGFVPTGFFEKYITKSNPLAVPLAVLIGVPLYSNAIGVIPIIQALVAKGIPLGTALAFMMAVVGLSLPEALILKKIMAWPLLAAFYGIVSFGIIIIGYIFNLIV